MDRMHWDEGEARHRVSQIPPQNYHSRMAEPRDSALSWTRGGGGPSGPETMRAGYEDPYFAAQMPSRSQALHSAIPLARYQAGSTSYSPFPTTYEQRPAVRQVSEMSESQSPSGGDVGGSRRHSQGPDRVTKSGKRARLAPDADQRLKTGRACDMCRSKKLRCEIISESDPPMCAFCKRRSLKCSFVLPISETRPPKRPKKEASVALPSGDLVAGDDLKLSMIEGIPAGGESSTQDGKRTARIQGETSVMFLLHSAIAVPEDAFLWYDSRHSTTWEVTDSGDGVIKVHHPDALKPSRVGEVSGSGPSPNEFSSPTVLDRASPPPTPSKAHADIPTCDKPAEAATLSLSTLQNLVNIYFESVAPLFPFVTRKEFLANASPPPQLLYAICGVAAARRDIPEATFCALRKMINAVMVKLMVAIEPSRTNIQTLLVLSLVGELNWSTADTIGTTALMRLAAAIRMAQHLGLHRSNDFPEVIRTKDGERDAQASANLESDRRIWAGCVIMDRWYATLHGVPCLINLEDCDSDLPSPRDVYTMADEFPPYLFMRELVKLSNLLQRILKTLYTPSGLTHVTDEQLHTLRNDISSWQDSLPAQLRYAGIDSRPEAGLLRLLFVTIGFLFFRLFMRMAYACPPHLTFQVEMEPWQRFLTASNEAIAWLNNNDSILDIWSVTSYAATACALIHYNTWIRRRDQDSINSLEIIKNCVRRWEEAVPSGHMVVRRKMTEVISLLDATARQAVLSEPRGRRLNPARGAINSAPTDIGVTFVPDRSRPSGGFYVVSDKYKGRLEDLPKGNYMRTDGCMAAESNARSTLEENAEPEAPADAAPIAIASNSAFSPVLTLPTLEGAGMDAGFAGTFETGLDGLPTLVQDWNQWDEFFQRLGDMPPPPPGELV